MVLNCIKCVIKFLFDVGGYVDVVNYGGKLVIECLRENGYIVCEICYIIFKCLVVCVVVFYRLSFL